MSDTDALVRECRVCLDGEENDLIGHLITPCACSGSQRYVHDRCLERWRQENSGGVSYARCQICRTPYEIERRYPEETLTVRVGGGHIWALGAVPMCVLVAVADMYSGSPSFSLIGQARGGPLYEIIYDNPLRLFAYYYTYTGFILALTYYTWLFALVAMRAHRRCLYWQHMWKVYFCGLCFACGFLYLREPYGLPPGTRLFRLDVATITTFLNMFILPAHANLHNGFVHELNTVYNSETVLSLPDVQSVTA